VAKTVDDNYSKGKALSGNHIREIIQSHITAGRLPEDVYSCDDLIMVGQWSLFRVGSERCN